MTSAEAPTTAAGAGRNPGPYQGADYLYIIRKRKWLILSPALVGGLLGLVFSAVTASQYESTSTVLVRPIAVGPNSSFRPDQIVSMGTERELVRSAAVVDRVSEQLGGALPGEIAERLTIEIPQETLVMNLSFRAGSAEAAQLGAQAFADAYIGDRQEEADALVASRVARIVDQINEATDELSAANETIASDPDDSGVLAQATAEQTLQTVRIADLQGELAEARGLNTDPGEVIQPAFLPADPMGTPPWLNVVLGLAAGGLVGLPLAFARERVDDTIYEPADLTLAGFPHVIGSVVRYVDPDVGDQDGRAEMYRRLALGVAAEGMNVPALSLVPSRAASTSEIASLLAISISHLKHDVVLIGANPEDPISNHLAVDPSPGLVEFIRGNPPQGVVQRLSSAPYLSVIAEGEGWRPDLPWDAIKELLTVSAIDHDMVVLNQAPLELRSEAVRIAMAAKNVILFVEQERTRARDLTKLIDELNAVGVDVLGSIFIRRVAPMSRLSRRLGSTLRRTRTVKEPPSSETR